MTLALIALGCALVAALCLALGAGRAIDVLGPRRAVPTLAVAAVIVAGITGLVLATLGIGAAAAIAPVAAEGDWSVPVVRLLVRVPMWVGLPAAGAVILLLLRAIGRGSSILLALIRSERVARRLRASGGPVVVVDDGSADAYTLAGLRGCVVISRALLDGLPDLERRMLTAHEMSHLRHRHHLYLHAVDLAVSANPLLRKVSGAVRLGVERWADEDAAALIGDRGRAAVALARTALTRSALSRVAQARPARAARPGRVPVLSAVGSQVGCRAQALLAPARSVPARRTVAVALALACLLVIGVAPTVQVHADLEQAELAHGEPGHHALHQH